MITSCHGLCCTIKYFTDGLIGDLKMLRIIVTYGTVAVGTTTSARVCLKNEELVSDFQIKSINIKK